MKKMINIISILGALLLFACEDNKEDDNSVSFEEVTTTNVNDGPFYYNFVEKKQNETSYHLVYKNVDAGGGFSMPSFSISNTVMLSIISGSDFESVQVPPAPSQFQPENGRIQYGGPNAALVYNMDVHKVSVSSDIYIMYDTILHKVFKIVFDDYSGGVVIFRFSELSAN